MPQSDESPTRSQSSRRAFLKATTIATAFLKKKQIL